MPITKIDDDIFQCEDCGAHAETAEKIVHYNGCEPGSSEKWQRYYEDVEIFPSENH